MAQGEFAAYRNGSRNLPPTWPIKVCLRMKERLRVGVLGLGCWVWGVSRLECRCDEGLEQHFAKQPRPSLTQIPHHYSLMSRGCGEGFGVLVGGGG